jgi:hypothetical protein
MAKMQRLYVCTSNLYVKKPKSMFEREKSVSEPVKREGTS